MKRLRDDPHLRPLLILVACVVGLAVIDAHDVLTLATAASSFETFATIGMVALGLGLTMMIREFDLSVVGMYSMAGCIAVVMGRRDAGRPPGLCRSRLRRHRKPCSAL
jgi:ribose/xylose/arabinose/galactoside ABC-type transport system permease subunit